MSRSPDLLYKVKIEYACVAQLVVQLIRNEQVAGSSPVTSSKIRMVSFGYHTDFLDDKNKLGFVGVNKSFGQAFSKACWGRGD